MSREDNYGLTGWKLTIQKHIFDLGMCFEKMERHPWNIHVCQTTCKQPLYYLVGCLCPWCFACYQRELLLWGEMEEKYSCCQDAYGKCWCKRCVRYAPHCCLCLEVHCCTGCAIGGNRNLMKQMYPLVDRKTETVLLICASICSLLGFFGTLITCCTNGCLNAQQEDQWIVETGKTGIVPYCVWNNDNGLYHCQKCEPCCGEPCNPLSGLYCFLCFCCCPICTMSKMYASSLDQDWACLNHFLPFFLAYCICPIIPIPYANTFPQNFLRATVRHNSRVRDKTGEENHCFGDCFLALCPFTGPCGACQEIRTFAIEDWDWLGQMRGGKMCVGAAEGDFYFIRYSYDGPAPSKK